MRHATTATIALGLVLLFSPLALGDASENDVEIRDATGDAGPAGAPLGPAAANLDIVSVDLASEDNRTTATMELAAFDVRPQETFYGTAYELNGSSFVWFGYGNVLMPFPPFAVEGFYGCHLTDEGEHCHELKGQVIEDEPGFQVEIPREWAPAGATLEDPIAAVFHDPFLPGEAGALWWQAAWPQNVEDEAGPGEDYQVPGALTSADGGNEALEDTSTTSGDDGSLDESNVASIGGPVLAGLGLLGTAGVVLRRR